jgi:hypothetical protein
MPDDPAPMTHTFSTTLPSRSVAAAVAATRNATNAQTQPTSAVTVPMTNSHAAGRDQANVPAVRTMPTTMSIRPTARLSTVSRAALHRGSAARTTR